MPPHPTTERLPFEQPLSDKDRKKLDDFSKEQDRADLLLEFAEFKMMEPLYEKRRALIKTIPNFWPVALLRHPSVKMEFSNKDDMKLIQCLENLNVKRDAREPRAYTIEFTFKKNDYFENTTISKEFKFTEPADRKEEKADADGFKWSMLDFDWAKHVKAQGTKIKWRPKHDLTRTYPVEKDADGEVTDLKSFFNWFTLPGDTFELGTIIVDEVYPDAIGYFTGEIDAYESDGGSDGDDDDDDDDDDD